LKISVWDTNLKIRLVGETIFNLLYWMYFPFIAVYFSESLGNNTAGFLMTIPPLISILGNIFGGNLADTFGRRHVMLIGVSIQMVMFALFALSNSSWINYIAFLGIGLGGAIYGPASDAMVADLVPDNDRKQVFATFITANNIGAVLGPALGAYFFFQHRSALLWTCAMVMFVYLVVIFIKINESHPNLGKKEGQLQVISNSIKEQWLGYFKIFRDKIFILYIFGGIFSVIAIMQLDLYLALYVTNYVPAQTLLSWEKWSFTLNSNEILGWMLGLNGILFVFFVMPVTKWFKNWRDRDVFILSAILAGIGMFFVGVTTNIWGLFLLTIVFTFGEIVRSPVINNFVSAYAPENARGQYMGAARLQFTIGRFLAPITVIISTWVPPIGVFGFILICAIISGLFYFFLYKNI